MSSQALHLTLRKGPAIMFLAWSAFTKTWYPAEAVNAQDLVCPKNSAHKDREDSRTIQEAMNNASWNADKTNFSTHLISVYAFQDSKEGTAFAKEWYPQSAAQIPKFTTSLLEDVSAEMILSLSALAA